MESKRVVLSKDIIYGEFDPQFPDSNYYLTITTCSPVTQNIGIAAIMGLWVMGGCGSNSTIHMQTVCKRDGGFELPTKRPHEKMNTKRSHCTTLMSQVIYLSWQPNGGHFEIPTTALLAMRVS